MCVPFFQLLPSTFKFHTYTCNIQVLYCVCVSARVHVLTYRVAGYTRNKGSKDVMHSILEQANRVRERGEGEWVWPTCLLVRVRVKENHGHVC